MTKKDNWDTGDSEAENNSQKEVEVEMTEDEVAIQKHLEQTRFEASAGTYVPVSVPGTSTVVSQFGTVVKTPVEAGLDGADPAAAGGQIDDFRDVESIATKLAKKAQKVQK